MVSRLKAPDLDSHKRTIDVSSFNTHTLLGVVSLAHFLFLLEQYYLNTVDNLENRCVIKYSSSPYFPSHVNIFFL